MSVADDTHRREVKAAVRRALSAGLDTPDKMLSELMGADPRLVDEILREVKRDTALEADFQKTAQREADARRRAADLPRFLPAADPMRSQWWFTLESAVRLSGRTWELAAGGAPAFLGSPTVGHHYCFRYGESATILDADPDVIQAIGSLPNGISNVYDAHDDLPEEFSHKHSVAVIDPPWYPNITRLFISRARDLIGDTGFMLCVLPTRLTRPGLIEERTALLKELLAANYEIVSLESQVLTYRVPPFEAAAYQNVAGFGGRTWRQGDLLVLRVGPDSRAVELPGEFARLKTEVFARKPTEFRVFLRSQTESGELDKWIASVPEFEQSVSTRAIPFEKIEIWGTNKKGGQIKNAPFTRKVLRSWADGHSPEQTVGIISGDGITEVEATRAVEQFREVLGLWTEENQPSRRRTPTDLNRVRSHVLTDLASKPSKRTYEYHDDQFRLEFQRDRDRVLWSHGLKRLANKSQVFPVDRDDHLRRRLSHSVEVMQLSATIARAFGLDPDLTEAGALAHDIGHTPFGHAGEHALDSILNEIDPELGGFSHYEHGTDIVRWLEDVYWSPGIGGFPGLNLTPETVECIFKHTFHRKGHPIGQHELFLKSKHKDLGDTSCHLEGQAVRIADKISYLISDLEDGIRMGVFTVEHLTMCRLFDHPPIDLYPAKDESLFERFISQRRALLQVLMEDVIVETDRCLGRLGNISAVRRSEEYTVAFSPAIQAEMTEVWRTLQSGILHRDSRVVSANMRAAKIVSELFLLYALSPALIEDRFVKVHNRLRDTEYMRHYEKLVRPGVVGIPVRLVTSLFLERVIGSDLQRKGDNWSVPLHHVIMAKDYVASLTDTQANHFYTELLRGSLSL